MVVSSVCMCIRDRCDSSTMGVSRSQKLFMTFKYTFVTGELLDIGPFFPSVHYVFFVTRIPMWRWYVNWEQKYKDWRLSLLLGTWWVLRIFCNICIRITVHSPSSWIGKVCAWYTSHEPACHLIVQLSTLTFWFSTDSWYVEQLTFFIHGHCSLCEMKGFKC